MEPHRRMRFRALLMWVHLVLGLTGAVILAIVGVTGAYITFQDPLFQWLNPVPEIAAFSGSVDAPTIIAAVEKQFTPRRVANISVRDSGHAVVVRLRDRTAVFVNPATATVIGSRRARMASLENVTALMRRLHTNLVLGPKGRALVTFATAEAVLLALTGLWLWWRKKAWQFRPWRGSVYRVSWDLHNATGIWFLIPVLAMAATGVLMSVPSPIWKLFGPPPTAQEQPRSHVGDGASTPVPLSRVVSAADSAAPGTLLGLVIPSAPSGTVAVRKAAQTVYVDQYSAAVLDVRAPPELNRGQRVFRVVDGLHTGELLGIPGRAIMTLGCLMLVVGAVTGVVLGWKRLLILAGKRAESADQLA